VLELEPGTSQEPFKLSSEQMLVSIKASMERLVAVVSDMEETLGRLSQEFITVQEEMT